MVHGWLLVKTLIFIMNIIQMNWAHSFFIDKRQQWTDIYHPPFPRNFEYIYTYSIKPWFLHLYHIKMLFFIWTLVVIQIMTGHQCNSLWASDAIWWHRYGSPLAQIMSWCLKVLSHYLNQCWLVISEVAFTWGQFHRDCTSNCSVQWVWKLYFSYYCHISQAPMSKHTMCTVTSSYCYMQ